jgi:hypothetical protein
LLANTVSARRQPEKAMGTLQKAVSAAQVLKGVRGEAERLIPSIFSSLEKNT